MNIFKSKNLSYYEELDPLPVPRRGQRKFLNYALVGIFSVGIAALCIVLIVNTGGSADSVVVPENSNNGAEVPVLRASGSGNGNYVLGAAGDPTTEPSAVEDVLVEIDQGSLRGKRMKSRGGREYLAFIGIPYAKPPVGELRFQPPVEAEPWEGTLNATTLSMECIQKDKYNVNASVFKGSEDCLYLNIYTSKKLEELDGRRQRLPVMVYIHGGGPFGNSSRYGGDYLMDEDVIFITFHYRLGALGNLNTNDSAARGNQGLKDQVMALQWVKDNIRKFGGDRRKVTLFGNSFGGMEVSTHLLSPMSKRLFHRAIVQSGVSIYGDYITENPREVAFQLGDHFSCNTTNSSQLVQCLRNVEASDIAISSYLMPFQTTVDAPPDPDSGDEDVVLPDMPLRLLQNGEVNKMPVIFGANSGEGIMFGALEILLSPNLTEAFNEEWTGPAVEALDLEETATDPELIADAARDFYFGERNVSRENVANLTNMFSDRNFLHPTYVFAGFQSGGSGRRFGRNRNQVYLYHFNRQVARKYSAPLEALYKPEHFLGASHADELQLLFPYDDYPYVSVDSEYYNISRTMVSLWASFANTGKPTGTTNEWLPINSTEKPYRWFQLDDAPQMIDTLGDRMNFWDSFNLTELYPGAD